MTFSSINIRGREIYPDLAKFLPPAQQKHLDDYKHKLAGILIPYDEIVKSIHDAAEQIASDYLSRGIDTIVGVYVLDGARKVFGHLQSALFNHGLRMIEDNIRASRYGAETGGGAVRYHLDVRSVFPGDNVLVVEDIFDEGITIESIVQHLELNSKPGDVKLFSLLFKPDKYKGKRRVDYPLFKIDDHWITGFGMDLSARVKETDKKLRPLHRDLPFVAATNPDYLLELGLVNEAFADNLRKLIKYKD